jgi:hypothetical protein
MSPSELNPYVDQIQKVLPRLLALYDRNPISPTLGLGDRLYWAWKLIDHGNATFQGAAHGLSRLVVNNQLPLTITAKSVTQIIVQMCLAVRYLQDRNGSVGEAFPYESSFCVTALVAYDLLCTAQLMSGTLSERELTTILEVVEPLVNFLHFGDEYHGLISNHLATAAAALFKFHSLTGEQDHAERGHTFLERILLHQSSEGWFKEYQGADPGYQSLCTHYLADLHRMRPDLDLGEPLSKSIRFLIHFANLDGSFGGLYGSRNTRFYYPSGFEMLRDEIKEAGVLADFMRDSIRKSRVVTLDTMDAQNMVPMFNSYCHAAQLYRESNEFNSEIPCLNKTLGKVYFPKAGLFIYGDTNAYTIISTRKGGVLYHFPRESNCSALIDAGVVYKNKHGEFLTSQSIQDNNEVVISEHDVKITAPLAYLNHPRLTPLKFIILRILNITLMRSLIVSDNVKRFLSWLLIGRKNNSAILNYRTIYLKGKLVVNDSPSLQPDGWERIDVKNEFSAMHMASQGYWQSQDTEQ